MFKLYYKIPFCYLSLHSDGKLLTKIEFTKDLGTQNSCSLLEFAREELDLYFSRKIKNFQTPLLIQGSDFQKKVYENLLQIPYGKVFTYKKLAQKMNHPKAFRALANANSKNIIPIFIPCHRVVASNGIGGYNGGLRMKRFLLETEGIKL